MDEPIPSLEWKITELCNYNCPYCHAAKDARGLIQSSGAVVDSVLDLICSLPGKWLVKITRVNIWTLRLRFEGLASEKET